MSLRKQMTRQLQEIAIGNTSHAFGSCLVYISLVYISHEFDGQVHFMTVVALQIFFARTS